MKKRKKCFICGGKKYLKYLVKSPVKRGNGRIIWKCINAEKCINRGANYKK